MNGSSGKRRSFSSQFKSGAVDMVITLGKPIAHVARDLGINEGKLGKWVNDYRRDHPVPVKDLSEHERQ